MGLDEANPVNQEFLLLEAQVIEFITDYKQSDSAEIQGAVTAMKKAFEELQQLRRAHWERGCRTFRPPLCQ